MEQKFFSDNFTGPFIFGEKPSIFDHALYHELLTAMVIPNIGKSNELFTEDDRFRIHRIDKMNKWY